MEGGGAKQYGVIGFLLGHLLFMLRLRATMTFPCNTTVTSMEVVELEDTILLRKALMCSGVGSFSVYWTGRVVVSQPILVANGSVLVIAGQGPHASIVDGEGRTRLFEVDGANLELKNVSIAQGLSPNGSGVYAHGVSRLSVSNCSFANNAVLVADLHYSNGGAIAMEAGGELSINGHVDFVNNSAFSNGGAIYMNANGSLTVDGEVAFVNNTAGSDGGAIFMNTDGVLTVDGEVNFVNNTAGSYSGGAISMGAKGALTLGGEVDYVNNTAASIGGAISMGAGGVLTVDGEIDFLNNNAASDGGGAISMSTDGVLTVDGKVDFVNNTARDGGGAIYVASQGDVTVDGAVHFAKNIAGADGGAIYISLDGVLTMDGEVDFINNTAASNGGSIYMSSDGVLTVGGGADFVNNTAGSYGGAISMSTHGMLSVHGEVDFVNNTAGDDGGAISMGVKGVLTLGGEVDIVKNTAGDGGGAIYLNADGTLTVDGEIDLVNNIAASNGGAIYMPWGGNLTVHGEVDFVNNTADSDGGAIYMNSDSVLNVDGAIGFVNNAAGSYGGAIFCSRSLVSVSKSAAFVDNTASGSGGALYCVTCDIKLNGVDFHSNTASFGGAVALVSSGSDPDQAGDGLPSKVINCTFESNAATDGGGFYSVAGFDTIKDSVFRGNFAETSGGAIAHSGVITSLSFTSFESNKAGEEGLAVMSFGELREFKDADFIGQTYHCDKGFYSFDRPLPVEESDSCRSVSVCARCTSGCGSKFSNVTFSSATIPDCVEAPQGVRTPNKGGATLETLEILRGYYRSDALSHEVLACYRELACQGGSIAGKYCADGYDGPFCASCQEGFAQGPYYSCGSCTGEKKRTSVAIAMVMIIIVMAIAVITVVDLTCVLSDSGNRRSVWSGTKLGLWWARLWESTPLTAVKILVVVWQIITQFSAMAGVEYPPLYQDFIAFLSLINVDIGVMLSMSCLTPTDFYDRLLLATICPLLILLALRITYTVALRRNRKYPCAKCWVAQKHMSLAIFLLFFVYSSVSNTIFGTFSCTKLDPLGLYLQADYSLACEGPTYRGFQMYATVMVFVYPVGIPAVFSWWLWSHRDDLRRPSVRLNGTPHHLEPFAALWKQYKPQAFYYELVECCRRIALTGLAVNIPDSTARIAIFLFLSFSFTVVSEVLSPFDEARDMWLYRAGNCVIFASMYLALLLRADVSDEDHAEREAFSAVLIAAHVISVIAVTAQAVVSFKGWRCPAATMSPTDSECRARKN